jgi:transcription antitermination protein NusB
MGDRRKARELALQMLFHLEFNKDDERWRKTFWEIHPATPSVRDFADQLVSGVAQNQKTIDGLIRKHAQHWVLERMTAVDRNIMRIAICELMVMDDVPVKVTLNEAIEIAKRYGDEASGAFVNGILDQVLKDADFILLERGEDSKALASNHTREPAGEEGPH